MPFLVIVKKLLKLNIIKARKKKMIEKTIEIEKLRGVLVPVGFSTEGKI